MREIGWRWTHNHKGRTSPGRTLREEILTVFAMAAGPLTAWEVAKTINALGSSVSSLLHKMAKRGEVRRCEGRSRHGGQIYRAQLRTPAQISNDACILNLDSPSWPPERDEYDQCGCSSCVQTLLALDGASEVLR